MKEKFINRYPLSKTLRFSLIPVGKTEENFNNKRLLEEDKQRAQDYKQVKEYIDRYHRFYIESVLSEFKSLEGLEEYSELYYKNNKNDSELETMETLEASMRKEISKALTSGEKYKEIFSQDMIKKILPDFLEDEEELRAVEMFQNFTTYFVGFYENRKNMYSSEAQTTAISHRCINENLPKFLDNVKNFEEVKTLLPAELLSDYDEACYETFGIYASNIFAVDYFPITFAQSGIDKYNQILGGYTCTDGTKVQGLNELINLHNQQIEKGDKALRLPLMKQLYKQILSDRETVSFIPEKFENDNEVLEAINDYYIYTGKKNFEEIKKLFAGFKDYKQEGIFIKSGSAVTDLSNAVFGKWSAVSEGWNKEYEEANPIGKSDPEKYYEKRRGAYKKIKSFSLYDIQRLGSLAKAEENEEDMIFSNAGDLDEFEKYMIFSGADDLDILLDEYYFCENVVDYYIDEVKNAVCKIADTYEEAESLLTCADYSSNYKKKLCANDEAIELIKDFLDEIKELETLIKPLAGTGKEENKDEVFYGEFLLLFDEFKNFDRLYDKVRNYVTQKPYSKNKIKLNFENPQLLGGWDKNKERDYRTVLLRKDGKYFLAIMDKSNNKIFLDPPVDDGSPCYEKVEYKLLPDPSKMLPKVFFANSNLETFSPSAKILKIRKEGTFKKGASFNLNDCHEFIDFFKSSISKHKDWSQFGFKFSDTSSYNDISEFYKEVAEQGYSIKFENIPTSYIDSLVEDGQLYLFQIYNKDFSEYSHGTPNMHTLYFKMLFDERNLKDVVFQLNGGAEMFYREASISDDEKLFHPANQPILNKNPDNPKKESCFEYDIVKNRRFTKRQFALHLPITLNFKAQGQNVINSDVRLALKEAESFHIIGIDRGERNLIYISVIDSEGKIVEQMSLNEIISDNNHKVNYHKLLDEKESERDEARKSWKTIDNIKELKEGYLSQVVHKICQLIYKYDNTIIAMEDLNFGFKRSRFAIEKQVYQKFENMLISKLNFLVDKKRDPEEEGGLLNAYQLTNKANRVNKGRQNGIIFYVPAWLTSKLDPTTGFVNLLRPKYSNVEESKDFFKKMKDIRYNSKTDMFEFEFSYEEYPRCESAFIKEWTVCTNGDRIKTFRNPEKNYEWDYETLNLTKEFKELFNKNNIDYTSNLKFAIVDNDKAKFHKELTELFALTLQLRNSDKENDYIISPVRNAESKFYDSRNYKGNNAPLPTDADANGAYNIARKALWAVNVLKETDDDKLDKANLAISNKEWLEFAQK